MTTIDCTVLRELLHYDPKTGILIWKTRTSSSGNRYKWFNTVYAGKEAGSKHTGGYLTVEVLGKAQYAHRVAWAWYYGYWPEHIDHVNGVRTDNRIANLRSCSQEDNNKNREISSNNTSGVMGVRWANDRQKWTARIGDIWLGAYDTMEEAICSRQTAKIKLGYHDNHGRRCTHS